MSGCGCGCGTGAGPTAAPPHSTPCWSTESGSHGEAAPLTWSYHRPSTKGFSELLIRDSRFRADTPGTWPAQICSMRTRRWATVTRKPSTCGGGTENRVRAATQTARGGWGPRHGDRPAHHCPSRPRPWPQHTSPGSCQVLPTPSRDTRDGEPCSRGNKAQQRGQRGRQTA